MRPIFVMLVVILSLNVAQADLFSGKGCSPGGKSVRNLLVLKALDAGYSTAMKALKDIRTQEVDIAYCFQDRLKTLCDSSQRTTWDWTNKPKGEYSYNHITAVTYEESELSLFQLEVRSDQYTDPAILRGLIHEKELPTKGITEVKCTVHYIDGGRSFPSLPDLG